jgi:hypothetical protein
MTRHTASWWIPALLLVLAMPPQAAALDGTFDAAPVVNDVENLAALQSWDDAEQKLKAGEAACQELAPQGKCRLQLEFLRGYLKQRQSESSIDADARKALLVESADAYRSVLEAVPGHADTTRNLALVLGALGATDELKDLVETSQAKAPALAAAVAASLGDLQAGQGDSVSAYRTLAQASAVTDDPLVKRKLIQVVRNLPSVPDDMPDTVRSWEVRSPAIAAEAYAALFLKEQQAGDKRAPDSLLRWVTLTAETSTPSSAETQALFAEAPDPSVKELVGYLKFLEAGTKQTFANPGLPEISDPYAESFGIGSKFRWWSQSRQRRDALGQVALSVGRASLVAGKEVNAQYQFLVGLQAAPSIDEYIIDGPQTDRMTPLDLITELVWLQVRFQIELDPSKNKFDKLLRRMFQGKADAYGANDLVAMQRHHSVLGPIFAQRKQWKKGKAQYDNALFQLSSAVRIAARRESQENFHQALPGIKVLLADGYRAVEDRTKEAKARVDATEAALDSDDLNLAQDQLERLIAISEGESGGPVGQRLTEILGVRRAARSRQPVAAPDWGTIDATPGLDHGFVARQQFKFLADVAAGSGDPEQAQAALASAGSVSTLIGMEDVLRMERLQAVLTGKKDNGTDAPATMKIVPGGLKPKLKPGEWLLSLPSSDLPFVGSLPPQS